MYVGLRAHSFGFFFSMSEWIAKYIEILPLRTYNGWGFSTHVILTYLHTLILIQLKLST